MFAAVYPDEVGISDDHGVRYGTAERAVIFSTYPHRPGIWGRGCDLQVFGIAVRTTPDPIFPGCTVSRMCLTVTGEAFCTLKRYDAKAEQWTYRLPHGFWEAVLEGRIPDPPAYIQECVVCGGQSSSPFSEDVFVICATCRSNMNGYLLDEGGRLVAGSRIICDQEGIFRFPKSLGGGKVFKDASGQWRRTIASDQGVCLGARVEVLQSSPVAPPVEDELLHIILYGDYSHVGPLGSPDYVEQVVGQPLIPIVHDRTKGIERNWSDPFVRGPDRVDFQAGPQEYKNQIKLWSTYSWPFGAKTLPKSARSFDYLVVFNTKSTCALYRITEPEAGKLETVVPFFEIGM